MLKNRTLIGIILIAAAIGLCFGISPLFNSILSSKTKIIRLRQDIPQGVQITGAMLEAVEVGTLNLPADMQNDPKQIIGKYTVSAMFAGDSFTDKKLSDSIDTSDSLLRQLKPNETAKGKVFTKTLWKYRVDSERIVDGKTVIDGRFVRVNPISKELRDRMHENGVPNDVLDRFSEVR